MLAKSILNITIKKIERDPMKGPNNQQQLQKVEQNIQEIGVEIKEKDMGSQNGQMVQNMKENGRIIELMETIMKDSGKIINKMVEGHSNQQVDVNMKDSGIIQQGYGTEVWGDGNKYEGYFYEGIKQGQGTYIWNDGSKQTGFWINNKRHGQGSQVWKNGKKYNGECFEDFMSGQGQIKWPNGYCYVGLFNKDVPNGYGILKRSNIIQQLLLDGKTYEGGFKQSKANRKGKSRFGEWHEGQLIKWFDSSLDKQKENFDILNLEDL
ncbi:unnamed protein product [Paramecium primaurelia]|uniref:MORN repeat protein n=1 Tax=Paramecium primaurelia TaxID=5886 RepID=A0A8S1LNT8_PARPR|nr:unnamed protein product [Paramecium primaurelia]